MVSISELKKGMTFIYNDKLYLMMESFHKKLGRGRALYKCKIKDILSQSIVTVTFSSNDKFKQAFIRDENLQFLYKTDNNYIFMNLESYNQYEININKIRNEVLYIVEGEVYSFSFYENQFIKINLPDKVRLKVIETEENVSSGNTEGTARKDATLETGLQIQVPLFIKNNEFILVNTTTGKYVSKY